MTNWQTWTHTRMISFKRSFLVFWVIQKYSCFWQVFGTFILCGCILAMTDKRNMMPHRGLLPLAVGAIVFGIGTCWAYNCGYALNPARDLGPRIFTAIAGWGVEPFRWEYLPGDCNFSSGNARLGIETLPVRLCLQLSSYQQNLPPRHEPIPLVASNKVY